MRNVINSRLANLAAPSAKTKPRLRNGTDSNQIDACSTEFTSLRNPFNALVVVLLFVALFTFLHLLTGVLYYFTNTSVTHQIFQIFNIGSDKNLPTYFATCQWLVAAMLCWKLARHHQKKTHHRRGWFAIAAIALFISIDEILMIHELTILPVRSMLPENDYLWFAWVVPYGIGTLIILLLLHRFVMSLPRRTSILIWVSGSVFVTGALGFEMLGAAQVANGNDQSITYAMLYTIEEVLEMVGVSIFIYALLAYMKELST